MKINPKICLASIVSVFLDFQVALVGASELDVPCVGDPCAKAIETTQENKIPIKINIKIHPIFDESKPEENNYLFRLANRLHIDTHESVVTKDLLVESGDYLDKDLLAESERILRARRYFNKASITTRDEENGQVDVDVFEVWTLVPSISYSHAGGKSTSSFGLHDSNFLGYGKTINILHTSSAERSGELFNYRDPNTGWHQTALNFSYADNSDGKHQYYEWVRPYFALSTVNAGGITYEQFDQEDSLYNAGEIVQTFGHSSEKQEFFYGAKMSLSDKRNIHRWNIGYTQEEDIFFPLDNDLSDNSLPHNRDLNTSWIEYAYIHDGYIEVSNIQQINRIEDINLGFQSRVRLGFTNSSYKEYDNSYQFTHNISQGFFVSEASLLLAEFRYEGLYNGGKIYNGIIEGNINYHWQNFESGQLYISLEGARGLRLFGDKALSLGGDNGLRGYPAYYQTGDKRYLLTMEQRFYGEKEWFSLFHMGYAIFYDQGRAWGDSLVPQSETGTLRDFGMGLRISGTRNGSRDEGGHNVLHIDIATPLDAGPDTSQLQWLVKVKHSF